MIWPPAATMIAPSSYALSTARPIPPVAVGGKNGMPRLMLITWHPLPPQCWIPAATASRLRSGVSTTRLTIRQGTTGRRGATPISLSGGSSPGSGCASPQTTLQVRVPWPGFPS
jgi:hypothetical protein